MSYGIVQLWSKSLDPENNVYDACFVSAAEQARLCKIRLESNARVEAFLQKPQ